MAVLYTNNATTTITAALTTSSTSISLATGTGALFPSPTSPDVFYATLVSGSTTEIVKVTAKSTDTLTVVRGQDGTTAVAWSSGATIEIRICKALLDGKQGSTPRIQTVASAATIKPTGDTADEYTVTALAVPATIAAPSGTPTDGQRLILRFKDNGTGRALT